MSIPTPYEDLLRQVLETGHAKGDRTGTGTRSLFGEQLRYDLSQGFPLITTKRVHIRSLVASSCCGSCAATPTCGSCTSTT